MQAELFPPKPLVCAFYDAGETNALVPVLKCWEKEGKEFYVLVAGTAETIITEDMFPGKRITLVDLGCEAKIDKETPRTFEISEFDLKKCEVLHPEKLLVGVASRMQAQFLELFSFAETFAYVDNFDYDRAQETYQTVYKTQALAKHVLCPSQHTVGIFQPSEHTYHVVGKPTLEVWQKQIAEVDPIAVLKKLGFDDQRPVVTFIGGYGPGYELMNPLFEETAKLLEENGFQVIIQPHPKTGIPKKVETHEALAVSRYVVGYNSSMILDAAAIDINALFFIPDDVRTPFTHFTIPKELIYRVKDAHGLLDYIRQGKTPKNVREEIAIPFNSVERIKCVLEHTVFEERVAS